MKRTVDITYVLAFLSVLIVASLSDLNMFTKVFMIIVTAIVLYVFWLRESDIVEFKTIYNEEEYNAFMNRYQQVKFCKQGDKCHNEKMMLVKAITEYEEKHYKL